MATVYILYSNKLDKFYIGSCDKIEMRLEQHLAKFFPDSFTSAAEDWSVYLILENLSYSQARKIESHIKKMKSKKYIENLKQYPEMSKKLTERHSD